jgi:chlorite dismutase
MAQETTGPTIEASRPAGSSQRADHGGRPGAAEEIASTLVPEAGWHFLHLYYRVDREKLGGLSADQRRLGREDIQRALSAKVPDGPEQLQAFAVPGHKADFGFIAAGTDLKAVHGVQLAVQASAIGAALIPTYSFYSISEISEYVPDAEAYARILREREGLDPEDAVFKSRLAAYAKRLGPMNHHRLYPVFPDWSCLCFYPMSKLRSGADNWYMLPFEARSALMGEHAKSGMKFTGKVSQVITASTGLDDWEWGVTLWSKNPLFLKDIVYTMRYDESSARYAIFGDFYFGYILPPAELLDTLRL